MAIIGPGKSPSATTAMAVTATVACISGFSTKLNATRSSSK